MPRGETVLYQENDGIALITLNRPQALNALNMKMLQRLFGLLDQAQANDSVKALVVTGAGDVAFSAGADIKFLNQATPLAVRSFDPDGDRSEPQDRNLGKSRHCGDQWLLLRRRS